MKEDKIIGHIYYIIRDVIEAGNVINVEFHEAYQHDVCKEDFDGNECVTPVLLDTVEINGIDNSNISVTGFCIEEGNEEDLEMDLLTVLKLTNLAEVLLGIIIEKHEKEKVELQKNIDENYEIITWMGESNKAKAELDARRGEGTLNDEKNKREHLIAELDARSEAGTLTDQVRAIARL